MIPFLFFIHLLTNVHEGELFRTAEYLISLDKKHILKLRDDDKKFQLNDYESMMLTPAEFLEIIKLEIYTSPKYIKNIARE